VRIAFRARNSADRVLVPSRTAEVAMEYLRADFENIVPPNPNGTLINNGGQLSFTTSASSSSSSSSSSSTSTTKTNALAGPFLGNPTQDDRGNPASDVIFFTTSDGPEHGLADGEIKQVELLVTVPPGTNDHVLVRRVSSNLLPTEQYDPDEEVICRNVSTFYLRYFDGFSWQDQWDSTSLNNELPVAVEITLELNRAPDADPRSPVPRFVRIIPIVCSSVLNDGTTSSSSSTTGGTP
jgi:hypothetical protein